MEIVCGSQDTVVNSLTLSVMHSGFRKYRLQSIECRAPEVWRGLGCWPSSDVWSLGVTVSTHILNLRPQLIGQLAHWLGHRTFFGINDKIVEGFIESWCIAKTGRLIGPLDPPVKNPESEWEFSMADELCTGTYIDPVSDGPVPYINVAAVNNNIRTLNPLERP